MSIYEEVEIEDLRFDPELQVYSYPCPCGDKFSITLEELHDGEDIATCPSCTLRIRVVFDHDKLPGIIDYEPEAGEEEAAAAEEERDGSGTGADVDDMM